MHAVDSIELMPDEDVATRLEPIAPENVHVQTSNPIRIQEENPSQQQDVTNSNRVLDQHQSATVDGVLVRVKSNIVKFWRRQIALVTGHAACRDHFANERTFLGYLRTASAVATLGVAGCQLFLLESETTKCRAQYARIHAYTCHATAIVIVLCGAYRFWRHQNAMARGKMQAGGWEVNVTGVVGLGIMIVVLVLILLDDGC